jgi:hypothetical protein
LPWSIPICEIAVPEYSADSTSSALGLRAFFLKEANIVLTGGFWHNALKSGHKGAALETITIAHNSIKLKNINASSETLDWL